MLKRKLITYAICLVVCSPFIMAYVNLYRTQQVNRLEHQVSRQIEAAFSPLNHLHNGWLHIYTDSSLYEGMKSMGLDPLYSIDDYAALILQSRGMIDSVMSSSSALFTDGTSRTLLPAMMKAMAFEKDSLLNFYSDRLKTFRKDFNINIDDERFFSLADRLDALVQDIYRSEILQGDGNPILKSLKAANAAQQFRLYSQRDVDDYYARLKKEAEEKLKFENLIPIK